MSYRAKIWSYGAVGATIFLGMVVVVALRVAQSPWFANYVREKIISTTEDSTGGRTELGSFAFDWRHLQVTITDFAIHGTEPAGGAPFIYAKRIVVRLKLLASLKKTVDLSYLGVEQPSVNVIVDADGRTNVPEPKVVRKSNKNPLETVVDLAIGKLDLTAGTVTLAHRSLAFSANGEDVRAQLSYRSAPAGYAGDIHFGKVVYRPEDGSPLSASLDIPMEIGKDSIDVRGARLATKESQINLTASISHMNLPVIEGHVTGSVSLAEAQRSTNASMKPCAAGAPCMATLDMAARIDAESIRISNARLVAGASSLEASGTLQGSDGNDKLQYQGSVALNEIGRLFQVHGDPEGSMRVSGHAQFRDAADYILNGQVDISRFAITEGSTRLRDIGLSSQVAATSHQIALTSMRIDAFKGEFDGSATLDDFAAFSVAGLLRNFLLREFEPPSAGGGYDGAISGNVEVNGNLKNPGARGLRAEARLTLAPGSPTGSQGVPVSGKLDASYDGWTEQVRLQPSWIALPHSRLELTGIVGKEVAVGFTSTNTIDLLPALGFLMESAPKAMPVTLRGSTLTLQTQVNGPISFPQITGHFATGAFAAGDRPFDGASADFSASPAGVSVANGSIARQSLLMTVAGSVGMSQWKTSEASPLQATLNLANGEIPDLLALAGQSSIPAIGRINASASVSGTLGNPQGAAHISAAGGAAYQQEFDRIDAQITLADRLIRLVSLDVADKSALIQANGTYTHPSDTLTMGRLAAHIAGNNVPLERVNAIEKLHPELAGFLLFNGEVTGDVTRNQGESEFVLTAVNADIRAQDVRDKDRRYGNLTARANTSGSNVTFDIASDLAGSTIKLNGRTTLVKDYPTTADADIQNLSVDSALALAGQSFPVTGTLGFAGRISGTWRDPTGDGQITLTAAKLYGEPIDSLRGSVRYNAQLIEIPAMRMSAPAGGLSLSASFSHPQNRFTSGQFEVRVQAPAWNLAQVRTIQQQKPGLGGTLQLDADAMGIVRSDRGGDAVLLTKLDGNASLKQIAFSGRGYGDVTLTAKTNGNAVAIEADSNFGKSVIHGTGEATLTPDYPLTARLSIGSLRFSNLREFIDAESIRPDVEALVEAKASISGPMTRPSEIQGTLQISKFELSASRRGATGSTPTVALQNEGPIAATFSGSRFAIQSAKLNGRGTEVAISGGAAFSGNNPMDLRVKATADLGLLQDIDKSIYSSGSVALDAAVTGKYSDPSVNGNLQLKNASIQVEGIPNGLSKANGSITLNGARASVQNLSAQSGGGKLTLTGFATRTGGSIRYTLRANAEHVRTRTQGISVVNSAVLTLSGTAEHSVLSGDVTVERVGIDTQSDIGSSLAQAASPKRAATESSSALGAIRLDVRVKTAPDVHFETTLAKTLNGTANLNLSGTAANPGVVGQINITEGDLVFFGNEYTVDHGSIAFYNPLAIEPRVDLALDTTVKSVQVTLTLNGPIDNLKLSYTSDPPLQFDEIVGLLATGKRPSSDPAIVAQQPAQPQQSVGEMGETAIVSQAVASPLSSRLQRVFGVNQLRIDPSFNSGSALPTARISLQQQISREITFTYTQDVSLANSELIRVEWIINPRFSAVATRDENGIFGVDFFYKRQFQ